MAKRATPAEPSPLAHPARPEARRDVAVSPTAPLGRPALDERGNRPQLEDSPLRPTVVEIAAPSAVAPLTTPGAVRGFRTLRREGQDLRLVLGAGAERR